MEGVSFSWLLLAGNRKVASDSSSNFQSTDSGFWLFFESFSASDFSAEILLTFDF